MLISYGNEGGVGIYSVQTVEKILMPRFHSILCMLIIPRDPDAHISITVIERLLVRVYSASRISNRT